MVEVQRCQPDWIDAVVWSTEVSCSGSRSEGWRVGEINLSYIVIMCAFLSWEIGVPDCSGFLVNNGDSAHTPPRQNSLTFITILMNRKSWSLQTPGRLEYFSPRLSLHKWTFVPSSMKVVADWSHKDFSSSIVNTSTILYELAMFVKKMIWCKLCVVWSAMIKLKCMSSTLPVFTISINQEKRYWFLFVLVALSRKNVIRLIHGCFTVHVFRSNVFVKEKHKPFVVVVVSYAKDVVGYLLKVITAAWLLSVTPVWYELCLLIISADHQSETVL